MSVSRQELGSVAGPDDRAAVTTPSKLTSDAHTASLSDPSIELHVVGTSLRLAQANGESLVSDSQFTAWSRAASSPHQHEVLLGFESSNGPTHCLDVPIGQVSCTRWMACARNKLWWMTPSWGQRMSEMPTETQFLLLEHSLDGPYSIILPLIDGSFRATLRADRDKNLNVLSENLMLRIESGDETVMARKWHGNVLAASSWNVSELIQRAMVLAARASGSSKPLAQKQLPDSLDYFGWCTWDAFYSSVSAMGVQDGLKSLHSGGVRPRTLIIDDGWQLTQVDEDFQEAFSTKALRKMKMPATETIDEVFDSADKTMLASYADRLEGSSDLATSMPGLSDPEYAESIRKSAQEHELREMDGRLEPAVRSMDDTLKNSVLPDISGTVMQLSKEPKNPTLWSRLVQRVAGWALGLVQLIFLKFYQNFVDSAHPNSSFVYFWEYLASGPLRWNMLQFYKVSGDFTRRITSVKSNGKFSSPSASSDVTAVTEAHQLKEVTDFLRQEYGLLYIYCWHSLSGYWGGVMPDAPDLSQFKPRLLFPKPTQGMLEIEPALRWNPAVLAGVGVVGDAAGLYDDMHRYLAAGGVDGVKVDCQAGVGLMGSVCGGGAVLANYYHTALEDSVALHFAGNHVINCMCHSTENLYRMRDSAVVRASDDFYPREPASNLPHIAACAYNSIFISELAQPDWDMFQSRHPAAHLHACARAVSGGAVYVSDKPGKHDFELLRRLVLRDGSVLRANRPGRPTRDCLFLDPLRDGATVLKVWTSNAHSGFLGLFNLQGSSWDRTLRQFRVHDRSPPTLTACCRAADVETLPQVQAAAPGEPTGRFASFTHGSSTVAVKSLWDAVEVAVASASADLVTFVPTSACGGVEFAPIGLAHMFNTGGAVKAWSFRGDADGGQNGGNSVGHGSHAAGANGSSPSTDVPYHYVKLRGEGGFVAYCGRAPSAVVVDGRAVDATEMSWDGRTGMLTVQISATDSDSIMHDVCVQFGREV